MKKQNQIQKVFQLKVVELKASGISAQTEIQDIFSTCEAPRIQEQIKLIIQHSSLPKICSKLLNQPQPFTCFLLARWQFWLEGSPTSKSSACGKATLPSQRVSLRRKNLLASPLHPGSLQSFGQQGGILPWIQTVQATCLTSQPTFPPTPSLCYTWLLFHTSAFSEAMAKELITNLQSIRKDQIPLRHRS